MQTYEYKVVAAPNRGEKARGAKTPADRYAQALATVMNDMARDGWEYLRADTLPSEERSGLTKRVTVYHSVLVFRRAVSAKPAEEAPRRLLLGESRAGAVPKLGPAEPAAEPAREPEAQPEPRPGAKAEA